MTIKVPSTLADELESKMRARQACKTEAAADTFTHEIGLLICGEPEAILTALRASPVIDREAVLEQRLTVEFFGHRAKKALELLRLVESENGCMDAEDERLNRFCDDYIDEDTINLCFGAGLLDQLGSEDEFTCELTPHGRAFLSSPVGNDRGEEK